MRNRATSSSSKIHQKVELVMYHKGYHLGKGTFKVRHVGSVKFVLHVWFWWERESKCCEVFSGAMDHRCSDTK